MGRGVYQQVCQRAPLHLRRFCRYQWVALGAWALFTAILLARTAREGHLPPGEAVSLAGAVLWCLAQGLGLLLLCLCLRLPASWRTAFGVGHYDVRYVHAWFYREGAPALTYLLFVATFLESFMFQYNAPALLLLALAANCSRYLALYEMLRWLDVYEEWPAQADGATSSFHLVFRYVGSLAQLRLFVGAMLVYAAVQHLCLVAWLFLGGPPLLPPHSLASLREDVGWVLAQSAGLGSWPPWRLEVWASAPAEQASLPPWTRDLWGSANCTTPVPWAAVAEVARTPPWVYRNAWYTHQAAPPRPVGFRLSLGAANASQTLVWHTDPATTLSCAWACPLANGSAGCARLALPALSTASPLSWLAALWGGDPLGPAWLLITAAAHPASAAGSVPADLRQVLALAGEAARAVGMPAAAPGSYGLRLLAGARLVREEIARLTCWTLPRPLATRQELRAALAAAGAPDDAALEEECREWRVVKRDFRRLALGRNLALHLLRVLFLCLMSVRAVGNGACWGPARAWGAAAGAPRVRRYHEQLNRLCCWSACCCVLGTMALVPAILTGPLSLLVRWDARALGCLLLALGAGSLLSWLLCVPLAAKVALRLCGNAWGEQGRSNLDELVASASKLLVASAPGPDTDGGDDRDCTSPPADGAAASTPPPAAPLSWYVRHVTECYVALWSLFWGTCALVPLAAYLSPWPWFVGTDRLLDLPPPSLVLVLALAAVPVGLALPWGWVRDESSALRGSGPGAADVEYLNLWYDRARAYRDWRGSHSLSPPSGTTRCAAPGGLAQTERDLRHLAALCASLHSSQLGLLLVFLADRCTELAQQGGPPRRPADGEPLPTADDGAGD